MAKSTKNDTNTANVAGRDQRVSTLQAWGQAEAGAAGALVDCFIIVAQTGATSPEEVAEARGWYGKNADGERVPTSSCAPYAATFNRAAKVADKLGINPTVKLIKDATKGIDGRVKEAVYNALGAALAETKAAGVKEATAAQARTIARKALAVAAEKGTEKATRKPATRKATQTTTATMAAAAVASGKSARDTFHALQLIAKSATGLAEPEGREAAWREALAKLGDAVEAFAVFK